MLTLAFSPAVWSLVFQWYDVTGGDDGLVNIWPAKWLSGTTAYYLFHPDRRRRRHYSPASSHPFAPFGYTLRATRDSARQAEATGINVKRVNGWPSPPPGPWAALPGSLFVFSKGSIFPNELEIGKSFDALIVVFLGGVKTLSGGVVGAAFMESAKDWLTRLEYWRLVLGLVIIGVVIIAPDGIVGTLRKVSERVGLRRTEEFMK
jgi:branched-chain amino acid transport system permease protein